MKIGMKNVLASMVPDVWLTGNELAIRLGVPEEQDRVSQVLSHTARRHPDKMFRRMYSGPIKRVQYEYMRSEPKAPELKAAPAPGLKPAPAPPAEVPATDYKTALFEMMMHIVTVEYPRSCDANERANAEIVELRKRVEDLSRELQKVAKFHQLKIWEG